MLLFMFVFSFVYLAPDGNEKPRLKKLFFLVYKERPLGSSFIKVEKKFFEGGLVMNSWIRHILKIKLFLQL